MAGGVAASDHIWLTAGPNLTDNVTVGQYQDGTHISQSDDTTHRCSTTHVNNVKFVDSTHFILNGGSSTVFSSSAPTTAQCPLRFNFSDAASVATSAAKFYAYDGSTDTNPWALGSGGDFEAFEANASITPAWVAANGSGSALTLQNQAAATSHNFFVGISAKPGTTGTKSGKVKITLTYV